MQGKTKQNIQNYLREREGAGAGTRGIRSDGPRTGAGSSPLDGLTGALPLALADAGGSPRFRAFTAEDRVEVGCGAAAGDARDNAGGRPLSIFGTFNATFPVATFSFPPARRTARIVVGRGDFAHGGGVGG